MHCVSVPSGPVPLRPVNPAPMRLYVACLEDFTLLCTASMLVFLKFLSMPRCASFSEVPRELLLVMRYCGPVQLTVMVFILSVLNLYWSCNASCWAVFRLHCMSSWVHADTARSSVTMTAPVWICLILLLGALSSLPEQVVLSTFIVISRGVATLADTLVL